MDNTEREEKKKEYSGDIIFKTSIIQVSFVDFKLLM